jgi:hypothetical protein
MYEIKSKIFLELTKTQKSALCNFLRALVKKWIKEDNFLSDCTILDTPHLNPLPQGERKNSKENIDKTEIKELILQKFLMDEKYYLEINASRFEFLKDFIDDENFISEAKLYIQECIKYYDYKKSQAPLIQAQKEFEKKKRKFFQDVKMSKEAPTKKQLSYYKSLCKRHNLEQKDTKELSKLDLRNMIDEIIDEFKTDYKNPD